MIKQVIYVLILLTLLQAIFWYNPSETFIDLKDHKTGDSSSSYYKQSHWMSESGLVDFFMFSGVSDIATTTGSKHTSTIATHPPEASGLAKIYYDYSLLTGFTAIPPMFSLGYHQCRWNYRDEKDVASVESTFEDLDYPLDVIWLVSLLLLQKAEQQKQRLK